MRGAKVLLRAPGPADQATFLAAAANSKKLHAPWVTAPSTVTQYQAYVARMAEPANRGYLVCVHDAQGEHMAGVINLTNMIHGAFRSGYLGYYAFAGFERQGLMRAGMKAVLKAAFTQLKLHRLEANIQPGNSTSIALVKACGFVQEGYSPRYLKIGGRWRDHERWAVLADR